MKIIFTIFCTIVFMCALQVPATHAQVQPTVQMTDAEIMAQMIELIEMINTLQILIAAQNEPPPSLGSSHLHSLTHTVTQTDDMVQVVMDFSLTAVDGSIYVLSDEVVQYRNMLDYLDQNGNFRTDISVLVDVLDQNGDRLVDMHGNSSTASGLTIVHATVEAVGTRKEISDDRLLIEKGESQSYRVTLDIDPGSQEAFEVVVNGFFAEDDIGTHFLSYGIDDIELRTDLIVVEH